MELVVEEPLSPFAALFLLFPATRRFRGNISKNLISARNIPMHLFIDTNAYLSFYQHTGDDVPALDKLFQEVTKGSIVLHIPRQVRDEFTRNRDARLAAAAKDFKNVPFKTDIPRHMLGLSKADSYQKAILEARKARDTLIAEANLKARTHQLDVDIYIKSLFEAGEEYQHDDTVFSAGKLRAERGNPPGKPGSNGDQYNWEMLLARVPQTDLYVITKDGDFVSALDGKDEGGMTYPNAFLREEWQTKKLGYNLYVFETLKALLSHYDKAIAINAAPQPVVKFELDLRKPEHAPDGDFELDLRKINVLHEGLPALDAQHFFQPVEQQPAAEPVPVEPEAPAAEPQRRAEIENDGLTPEDRALKHEAMKRLIESESFAVTHAAISELKRFVHNFTTFEANALCDVAQDNTQITWIFDDKDVTDFYSALVSHHFGDLNPDTLDNMIEMLGLAPDEEEDANALD
ncbi:MULTISPECIES: PIN domain-containing protein [Burkholderia]|uniref:PIN domain-containing protein n=1 Tax=Burkholderia TaxID=32008 RepID=UPI0013C4831A|nr:MULTISPECIES: PIN domain-containing protein [Burkholderia]